MLLFRSPNFRVYACSLKHNALYALLLLLLLPLLQAGYDSVHGSVPNGNATWQELLRRYCLLSRSSLRVKDSELKPGQQYATMSDDLIMVHAAVELGKQVRDAAVCIVLSGTRFCRCYQCLPLVFLLCNARLLLGLWGALYLLASTGAWQAGACGGRLYCPYLKAAG
jgi:hypothetical protein